MCVRACVCGKRHQRLDEVVLMATAVAECGRLCVAWSVRQVHTYSGSRAVFLLHRSFECSNETCETAYVSRVK